MGEIAYSETAPAGGGHRAAWPEWFGADPAHTALLCDFDGTLAPIVDDPAKSEPLAGVVEVLGSLSDRFGTVAVVSGRPASFLASKFWVPSAATGTGPKLVGLYGLETAVPGGTVERPPEAEQWLPVFADLARAAEQQRPQGVIVELKGLTLALHWRTAAARPRAREWAERFARDAAARRGLDCHDGRMSIELRPAAGVDKGTVVEDLAGAALSACFVGDDVGDLPAFDALDRLRRRGANVVRVAVASTEAPPALLQRADLVVDGPAGALGLLRQLC